MYYVGVFEKDSEIIIQFLSSKIRNRVTIVDFEFSCSTRYMTFNLHKVLFDDFGKMQVKSTGKIS